MRGIWKGLAAFVSVTLALVAPASWASHAATTLVSVSHDGLNANGYAYTTTQSISGDGRFVAFSTDASNILEGDVNGVSDVFVRDRATGITIRASVPNLGGEADGASDSPAISANGRFVAFISSAANLVAGDTNRDSRVFVRDLVAGRTELGSADSDGKPAGVYPGGVSISADARFVTFASSAPNLPHGFFSYVHVYVRDRRTGTTKLVSANSNGQAGTGHSLGAMISPNGRYVAFESWASDLVAGDTNGDGQQASSGSDVFLRDLKSGTTTRVSVTSSGAQTEGFSRQPSISGDGRYVAFLSWASDLVPGDTNAVSDIFVHDRKLGPTVRVSVASDGSQANDESFEPAISQDGKSVAFISNASNLVAGDTNRTADVFVRPLAGGGTTRESLASAGWQANSGSAFPAISGDGRFVAFTSEATNLVTTGGTGVFVRDRFYDPSSDATPGPSDVAAPATTSSVEVIDGFANEGWTSGSWRVTLSCSDGFSGCESILYVLDDGDATEYAGPFVVGDEGRHRLRFWSRDFAGNVEGAKEIALLIDRQGPSASLITQDGSIFVPPLVPVKLTASASDPALPDGAAGSGAWYVCFNARKVDVLGPPWEFVCGFRADFDGTAFSTTAELDRGTWEIRAIGVDITGNAGPASQPITIHVLGA